MRNKEKEGSCSGSNSSGKTQRQALNYTACIYLYESVVPNGAEGAARTKPCQIFYYTKESFSTLALSSLLRSWGIAYLCTKA
jgi:hypothetical protein